MPFQDVGFPEAFRRLSRADQDEILEALRVAVLMRSVDAFHQAQRAAQAAVTRTVEVFQRNDVELTPWH